MPAPKGHPPYNKNGEGGRPKIYDDKFLSELAKKLDEWVEADQNNIFIERFCLANNIPSRKITDFKKTSERFSEAYDKLLDKQKVAMFEGGLRRKFAHPMCALILSYNHGVYQKTEQKISGDVANPLAFVVEEVDGITKDLVNE